MQYSPTSPAGFSTSYLGAFSQSSPNGAGDRYKPSTSAIGLQSSVAFGGGYQVGGQRQKFIKQKRQKN